jgi:hypothetical protein
VTGRTIAPQHYQDPRVVWGLLCCKDAGPVIYRFPRKYVLIAADVIQAALAVGLVFASSVWQISALAFSLALATVFFTPALSASIPVLVEGEDLLAANKANVPLAISPI